jgi:hypothetical protein
LRPVIATTGADRPAAEVFGYATDPARFHEWQAGVTEGHLDHPGPAKVGTRCLTTRRIGGASRVVTSEVTRIDPPRAWGIRGIDGPIRATLDLTVEPLSGSTSRLTIAVNFEGHGAGKILVPLLVRRGSGGLDRVDALDRAGLEPFGFDDLESRGPDEGIVHSASAQTTVSNDASPQGRCSASPSCKSASRPRPAARWRPMASIAGLSSIPVMRWFRQ